MQVNSSASSPLDRKGLDGAAATSPGPGRCGCGCEQPVTRRNGRFATPECRQRAAEAERRRGQLRRETERLARAGGPVARRLPADPNIEAAVLGGLLLVWDRAPASLTSDLFYVPAHRAIFDAGSAVAARGDRPDALLVHAQMVRQGTAELLPGGLPDLVSLGRDAASTSAVTIEGWVGQLAELAAKRERALEASATLEALAPILPIRGHEGPFGDEAGPPRSGGHVGLAGPEGGRPIEGGTGYCYVPATDTFPGMLYRVREREGVPMAVIDLHWAPRVLDRLSQRRSDGVPSERRYRIKVGADVAVVEHSRIRDGSAWDLFSDARGTGTRRVREALADLVEQLGGELERRHVDVPAWDGTTLTLPDPGAVQLMNLPSLAGYGQVADGADREHWQQACQLLASDPAGKGALYVGAALGGLFLAALGLDDDLDPLAFVVHATGEGRQGKTTMQRVAAAVLGNPANGPTGLVWSWGTTGIGLGERAQEAGQFPLVCSDTSAFRGRPAELGQTVFAVLEGARTRSGRTGGLHVQGMPYQSIILSSGNRDLASTMAGSAILSRVVQLPSPLTQTAADAARIKKLTRAGYGWPLANLSALSFESITACQQEAASQLAGHPSGEAVVEDVALRCSVLVCGAWALGELAGEGPAMRDAAMRAARAVLDDLAATMADSHRPLAQLLLGSVWEARNRRPASFPPPETRDEDLTCREREGFWLSETERSPERLALYRAALTAIATEAGIDDPLPALRELRSAGVLATMRGRLTGQFHRAGRLVKDIYIFERGEAASIDDPGTPVNDPPSSTRFPPQVRVSRAQYADQGSTRFSDPDGPEARTWPDPSDQPSTRWPDQVRAETAYFGSVIGVGEKINISGADTESGGSAVVDDAAWTALAARLGALGAGSPVWEWLDARGWADRTDLTEAEMDELTVRLDQADDALTAEAEPIPPDPPDLAASGKPAGVALGPEPPRAAQEPPGAPGVPQSSRGARRRREAARPQLRPPVVALDGETVVGIDGLGDVAARASQDRAGEAMVWVSSTALTALGLPETIPWEPPGRGVAHPFAERLGSWNLVKPDSPAGLSGWMTLRDGERTVHVVVPAWSDQWPAFEDATDAATLARAVESYRAALWPDAPGGWDPFYGPATTFTTLAERLVGP